MQTDFWCSRNTTQKNIFQARLRRGSDSDSVTITTESGRDPENIDLP